MKGAPLGVHALSNLRNLKKVHPCWVNNIKRGYSMFHFDLIEFFYAKFNGISIVDYDGLLKLSTYAAHTCIGSRCGRICILYFRLQRRL